MELITVPYGGWPGAEPNEDAELASLRASLRDWLGALGLSEAEQHDLLVVCGEACTNAIEHAYGGDGAGEIAIELRRGNGQIQVALRDFGQWRRPAVAGRRGRGLPLMRAIMDDVEVTPRESGTTITMRRRIGA